VRGVVLDAPPSLDSPASVIRQNGPGPLVGLRASMVQALREARGWAPPIGAVRDAFRAYKDTIRDRVVVLSRGEDWVLVPWSSRFTERYAEGVRRKFAPVKGWGVVGVLLTLTMRAGFLEVPETVAPRVIWRWLDRVMREVRREYPGLQYLAALEFTERHRPHLHVLFLGVEWIGKQAAIRRLWRRASGGDSYIVDVRRVQARSAFRYVMKYVLKLQHSERDQAVMWFCGARFYNTSRDFFPGPRGPGRPAAGFVKVGVWRLSLLMESGVPVQAGDLDRLRAGYVVLLSASGPGPPPVVVRSPGGPLW
jgi:hypothetical protein